MFCPDCGLEDKQSNQFCRACGSDLRSVRNAIERPDTITASAISARDEIGRAIAAKIRETRSADELAVVTEEVLPEIEKFLESPEEKRLRRMRAGTIMSFIGVGTAIGISVAAIFMNDNDVFFLAALGVVCLFIGLGIILNGLFLTVPRKGLSDRSSDANSQRELDGIRGPTNDLVLPEASPLFSSVTENTTQHLKEKEPVSRD
jgi:hypothetical protein